MATFFAVAWTVVASLNHTDGHLVYALDDAYIHMTVARNVAQHAVWGINADRFASASSSPLWVLLLAASYSIFGVHEITSLLLNVIACVLLLVVVFVAASRARMRPTAICVLLVAIGWLTPLNVLVMYGMEHVVQTVVDLAFVACAVTVLSEEVADTRRSQIALWALAAVVTATRYEGVFLVAIVAVLLLARGRMRDMTAVGTLGAFPIVIFGAFSLAHGGFFLPNSVLVKAQFLNGIVGPPSTTPFVARATQVPRLLATSPHVLLLLGVSLILIVRTIRDRERWTPTILWHGIFAGTVLLHLQFAAVGWFRYEAYLVAIGLVAIAITTIPMHAPGPMLVAGALLLPVLGSRALLATTYTPAAAADTFRQQYQMGLFVHDHYPGGSVAVNDIGAVSFIGSSRILDFVGLADMETARARLSRQIDSTFMRARAREDDVEVAIVYESWFPAGLPPAWRKIGQWTIPNRVSVADATVTFFAVNPAGGDRLIANLQAFSPRLPSEIVESGVYTQSRK
jgi:hypothetical protein